jgi:hypothetical protein
MKDVNPTGGPAAGSSPLFPTPSSVPVEMPAHTRSPAGGPVRVDYEGARRLSDPAGRSALLPR